MTCFFAASALLWVHSCGGLAACSLGSLEALSLALGFTLVGANWRTWCSKWARILLSPRKATWLSSNKWSCKPVAHAVLTHACVLAFATLASKHMKS